LKNGLVKIILLRTVISKLAQQKGGCFPLDAVHVFPPKENSPQLGPQAHRSPFINHFLQDSSSMSREIPEEIPWFFRRDDQEDLLGADR
jgi:hypothetical protein